MKPSDFRLIVHRYSEEDLYFYYDTRAELKIAELIIQKGMIGVSGVTTEQWVDKDHIRYNGEAGFMPISIF